MAKLQGMSEEEFLLFNDFLSDHIGLTFPPHKKELLEARLAPRVLEMGFRHFREYYLTLMYNANGELQYLANSLTNNETYFLREKDQYSALFEHGIEFLKKSGSQNEQYAFLSAGCSSGEEPYSLSILAKENQFRFWGSTVEIDAFDIDADRVKQAQVAEYGERSLRALDADLIPKYFNQSLKEEARYSLRPTYRQGVAFSRGNILDISAYLRRSSYDAIFCRNVLIYFSETALHRAIRNFAASLRPGGLLFLGHSESIIGMSKSFEATRLGNCIAYMRV